MFELNLAGHLHQKGLPIHLPANPDILCKFGWARFYIQCKRPFAEAGVPTNILGARAQLTRDMEASGDSSARGLIAISVSRILNPGNKLLITRTEAEVGEKLADDVQSVGRRHSRQWRGISDKQVIGILSHIITPVFIEEEAILTVADQMVVFVLPHVSDVDRQVLRDLSDLLREET